jgi:hypothetical protein
MYIPQIYDRMAELVFKEITGDLSEHEAVELKAIIESSPNKKALYNELTDPDIMAEQVVLMSTFDVKASWENVKRQYPFPHRKRELRNYLISAAIILAVCSIVFIYILW